MCNHFLHIEKSRGSVTMSLYMCQTVKGISLKSASLHTYVRKCLDTPQNEKLMKMLEHDMMGAIKIL